MSVAEKLLDALRRVEAAQRDDPLMYRLWRFRDAPEELQALSRHGGDEDWLLVIPPGGEWPTWAYEGGAFGCCSVSSYDLVDGSLVLIGAHS